MDTRRDEGQYYMYGKRVMPPSPTDGDVRHAEFEGIEELPEKFTDEDVRKKMNTLIGTLKGTTAAIAVAFALPLFGAGVTVETARKGEIYNDEPVVVGVAFDASGLATTGDVARVEQALGGKADAANIYTKAETDARIVELAPAPGDYATISNRAMHAVQTETDPVWNAEKGDYATIDALAGGIVRPSDAYHAEVADRAASAEYSDFAGYADKADIGTHAEYLYFDGDAQHTSDLRSGFEIFAQLDAAAETNAAQTAQLSSLSAAVSALAAPKRYALFIVDVNCETDGAFVGFELKGTTNNFSHAVSEDVRLQYYSQSEIADTGVEGHVDRMMLFVCTSHDSEDVRSWTRIANTIDFPHHLTRIAALVDVTCLERHPDVEWLRDDNEELIWCYLRNRANDPPVEYEQGTTTGLWRTIVPVRWYRELPAWARGS